MKKRQPIQRRTPLRRGGNSLKRSPIKRGRSAKKRKSDRHYETQWALCMERDNYRCQARIVPKTLHFTCRGRANVVHHKAGRLGPDPHHLDKLVSLCDLCHDWIHAHPAWSYAAGFMTHRNT